ncbi:MAG: hypothetical protein KAT85_02385 [candidate division Zixibacteria bacterium]|nr:hypothetical protein [candidate division Zixibacteria bacterium]
MARSVHLRWIVPVAILMLFIGCSSDSGTDTTIKQGNPNDADFLAVRAEVNEVLDSLVDRTFNPLTNPWGFPLDTMTLPFDLGPFHPGDAVEYGYENGWYSLLLGSFATSINSMVVDSVMFLLGDNPSSSYNIHTTGIHVKSHITITYDGQETDYTEQTYFGDIRYTDVEKASALVDADITWEIEDYYTVGTVQTNDNFDITVTIDELQYDRSSGFVWVDNIPSDGTFDLTVTVTTQVTDGSETTTATRDWSFDVTFSSGGSAAVEVISNNTRWTYSDNFGS